MNNLTENQEKLIEQIKKEFLSLNRTETPKSFADLLLNEINETRIEIESIKSKSHALFEELHTQYIRNLEYLKFECAKLGIGVEHKSLSYKDTSQFCTASITLKHDFCSDYDFSISVRIPTYYYSKNGLSVYRLGSYLRYGLSSSYDPSSMQDFDSFLKNDNFKDRITQLYHRIKK